MAGSTQLTLKFEEAGMGVYWNDQAKVWTMADESLGFRVNFSSAWAEDQIRAVCKIARKALDLGLEQGRMQGNLDIINNLRGVLLLDRMEEV